MVLKKLKQKSLFPFKNSVCHQKDKIVPIVLAINEKYVPYAMVTLYSILEHTCSDKFYDIYILHTDLQKKSQMLLKGLTGNNVCVSCLNVSKKLKGINLYNQGRYPQVMWYRLFIPKLFGKYKKVLYLDTDLVVESDVADLFDTDLKNAWLGGCCSWGLQKYAKDVLNLRGITYFNSGVLLFNIPQWRKNHLMEKCLKLINPKEKYKYPDQDILNLVCGRHTFILPTSWNCVWYNFDMKAEPWFSDWYRESFKNARIIHYATTKMPWELPQKKLADRWWKYAKILLKASQKTSEMILPIAITKTQMMAQKEKNYCEMVKFIQGTLKGLFCFGKKREKHQAELGKLLIDMCKKNNHRKID